MIQPCKHVKHNNFENFTKSLKSLILGSGDSFSFNFTNLHVLKNESTSISKSRETIHSNADILI